MSTKFSWIFSTTHLEILQEQILIVINVSFPLPRKGIKLIAPGEALAEPGVKSNKEIRPGRGARRGVSVCILLSPLPGLSFLLFHTPGSASALPGANHFFPYRGRENDTIMAFKIWS